MQGRDDNNKFLERFAIGNGTSVNESGVHTSVVKHTNLLTATFIGPALLVFFGS